MCRCNDNGWTQLFNPIGCSVKVKSQIKRFYLARSPSSKSHPYSASCHLHRNSSNCFSMQSSSNGLNAIVSGEGNTHVAGMQRDDLKATLPLPTSSADENDDGDGNDILIRRSASGVFRYSCPAISNTAHLCFDKSNTERLKQGHSHSGEQYGDHQGEVESPEITQGQGNSTSLRRSRHNLEPENTGRDNGGRIRPMAAKEKTKGINSGCSRGNSIDVLQHAEDNREFSQVNKLNLKSIYVLYNS